VNIIHVDIVEIWNLLDKHRVGPPQLPAVKNAQRNKHLLSNQFKINVPHHQRSSHTSWWRNVEVGVLHYTLTSLANSTSDSDWNVFGDKLPDWVYDVYQGR
jgi:hypothetical protein